MFNSFIFLASACIVVPLASRFRLGSVLGYLAAGILIGPFGVGLIGKADEIMHFAEFGVIMMLFLIGLEVEPAKLWRLRKFIVGLGGLQVVGTTGVFMGIGLTLGFDWRISLACAMALSLSSTALVLQMLQEKGLQHTSAGESSFAVLLFQDIAVIPILIIMPLLVVNAKGTHVDATWLSTIPGWAHALLIMAVITFVVITGRYFSHHMFRFIAKTNLREVFTATSLALLVGTTLLMQAVGVSPALGAFVAGMMLANSEYKHTLETDIEPFKGLLLGLFFISVGMGMNFTLLTKYPASLMGAVATLIVVKALILFLLGRFFGLERPQKVLFAAILAQGGEFAFVLFQYAGSLKVVGSGQLAFLTFAVALSMAATPFLMLFIDRYILPRFITILPEHEYDAIEEKNHPIIIAGYGRYGQVIGRFMAAQGLKLTILENDPDQIDLLRKYGNKVYFGDASRLELLRNAGADQAKLLIVAVDDADKAVEIVRLAKNEFPNLKVLARARNRRHAYELYKAGADYSRREIFDSSIVMACEAMKFLGWRAYDMHYKSKQFIRHDEKTLKASFALFEQEPELISFAQQASHELERILQSDLQDEDLHIKANEGWGN